MENRVSSKEFTAKAGEENKQKSASLRIEYFQKERKIINARIDGEMIKNSEKCKLLFSKAPFSWCGITFYVSGYEILGKNFYAVKCKNAAFFSPDILRSLFCLRDAVSPLSAFAFSFDGSEYFARLCAFASAEEQAIVSAVGAIIFREFL